MNFNKHALRYYTVGRLDNATLEYYTVGYISSLLTVEHFVKNLSLLHTLRHLYHLHFASWQHNTKYILKIQKYKNFK